MYIYTYIYIYIYTHIRTHILAVPCLALPCPRPEAMNLLYKTLRPEGRVVPPSSQQPAASLSLSLSISLSVALDK